MARHDLRCRGCGGEMAGKASLGARCCSKACARRSRVAARHDAGRPVTAGACCVCGGRVVFYPKRAGSRPDKAWTHGGRVFCGTHSLIMLAARLLDESNDGSFAGRRGQGIASRIRHHLTELAGGDLGPSPFDLPADAGGCRGEGGPYNANGPTGPSADRGAPPAHLHVASSDAAVVADLAEVRA